MWHLSKSRIIRIGRIARISKPLSHRESCCRGRRFGLFFAPAERYVYRSAIGPMTALQRSDMCYRKHQTGNVTRGTVTDLLVHLAPEWLKT